MQFAQSLLSAVSSPFRQREERMFTVVIYEDDYKELCSWVLKKPNIETGGDLFGLWKDKYTAVVQLVLGPGEKCRRSSVSFYQDLAYLKRVGSYLTDNEGLCHIGEWHSHHTLGLARPSGGDENTVWSNMPTYRLQRFFIFIANISHTTSESLVNVGCFLFELEDGNEKPVFQGKFEILPGRSPMRSNDEIMKHVHAQEESQNSDLEKREQNLQYMEDGHPTVAVERKMKRKAQTNTGRGKEKKPKGQKQQTNKKRGAHQYAPLGARTSKEDHEQNEEESESSTSGEEGSDGSTWSAGPQTQNDPAFGTEAREGTGSRNQERDQNRAPYDPPGKDQTTAADQGEKEQTAENKGKAAESKPEPEGNNLAAPVDEAGNDETIPGTTGNQGENDKTAESKGKSAESKSEPEGNNLAAPVDEAGNDEKMPDATGNQGENDKTAESKGKAAENKLEPGENNLAAPVDQADKGDQGLNGNEENEPESGEKCNAKEDEGGDSNKTVEGKQDSTENGSITPNKQEEDENTAAGEERAEQESAPDKTGNKGSTPKNQSGAQGHQQMAPDPAERSSEDHQGDEITVGGGGYQEAESTRDDQTAAPENGKRNEADPEGNKCTVPEGPEGKDEKTTREQNDKRDKKVVADQKDEGGENANGDPKL